MRPLRSVAHPREDLNASRNGGGARNAPQLDPQQPPGDDGYDLDTEEQDQPAFFEDPRKLIQTLIAVVILVIAIPGPSSDFDIHTE